MIAACRSAESLWWPQARQGAEAIRVSGVPLFGGHSAKIVELAARYRLPAIYLGRRHVQDGGLMSYAPNNADFWHRAAAYVDKILKGERPGDLPVSSRPDST